MAQDSNAICRSCEGCYPSIAGYRCSRLGNRLVEYCKAPPCANKEREVR